GNGEAERGEAHDAYETPCRSLSSSVQAFACLSDLAARPRYVHHHRAVIRRAKRHHRVRARPDHAHAPDVVDALRRVVHRGGRAGGLREITVARLREEAHLEDARIRVHIAGDDRDLLAVPLTEDRTHLLLAERARIGDLIAMRRHDQYGTDVRGDCATAR